MVITMWKNSSIFASVYSLFPAVLVYLIVTGEMPYFWGFGFLAGLLIYFFSFPIFMGVDCLVNKVMTKFSKILEQNIKATRYTIAICTIGLTGLSFTLSFSSPDLSDPYSDIYWLPIAFVKAAIILTLGIWILFKIHKAVKNSNPQL